MLFQYNSFDIKKDQNSSKHNKEVAHNLDLTPSITYFAWKRHE